MIETEVIVIGAGASGLAVSATLLRRGRKPVVLESDDRIGGSWGRRYDRLCLHTVKRFSGLPFLAMPRDYPRYVSKDLYAAYLAGYASRMEINVRLHETVEHVSRAQDGRWLVTTTTGAWLTSAVVMATGKHRIPRLPSWPEMSQFGGHLIHASDYRTGRDFAGKHALVIGIGNSGAEIAVDLVEQGARSVTVSARRTPPISSREILGVPIQVVGILMSPLSPKLVDRVGAVLRRIGTGDLTPYGLGNQAWGPFTARRPPVVDCGFVALLKAGSVRVVPDIDRFTRDGVRFLDGTHQDFDVVIAATGYVAGLERLISEPDMLDCRGLPASECGAGGLYFAGYPESPRGQLFEAGRQARRLANDIDRFLRARA